MEELKQLVSIANKALPGAWEAAVRQAYILGGGFVLFGVILGILSFTIYLKMNMCDEKPKEEDKEDDDPTALIMFLVMCISGLSSALLLIKGVMHLANAHYYAIQLLKP